MDKSKLLAGPAYWQVACSASSWALAHPKLRVKMICMPPANLTYRTLRVPSSLMGWACENIN